jgi:cysteine-rich repeat protein
MCFSLGRGVAVNSRFAASRVRGCSVDLELETKGRETVSSIDESVLRITCLRAGDLAIVVQVNETDADTSRCGDGVLDGAEQCDDLNSAAGDGCSSTCTIESGFSCDGSPSVCSGICGDGVVVAGESCDDANDVSGDGCSFCLVDSGYDCSTTPGVCTLVLLRWVACRWRSTAGTRWLHAASRRKPDRLRCPGRPRNLQFLHQGQQCPERQRCCGCRVRSSLRARRFSRPAWLAHSR